MMQFIENYIMIVVSLPICILGTRWIRAGRRVHRGEVHHAIAQVNETKKVLRNRQKKKGTDKYMHYGELNDS